MIRFVLKSAFWLGLAFLIMPRLFPSTAHNAISSGDLQQAASETGSNGSAAGTADGLLATGNSLYQVGKFCMDNQALCENGGKLMTNASGQAIQGTASVLDYLSRNYGTSKSAATPQQVLPVGQDDRPLATIPIPTARASILRQLDRNAAGAVSR